MILLMTALYLIEWRFTCGLLVGLAISAKLLPGGLWLPILLAPRGRGRYLAGIAMGLVPCLPFLLWNPHAFFGNVFLYNALRPVQDSSAIFGLPKVIQMLAKLPAMVIYLLIARKTWRGDMDAIRRCGWAVVLTLSLLLAAPINHPNYDVWWLVPLCVTTTAVLFNPACYEWMSRGPKVTNE